mmetsp:Transcript_84908/g.226568  ORF Transcript_84908/g.226568 Transcript_84908/m.226568 type:complete len:210 (-) Transcript_84908:1361-1990(-)
MQCHPWKPQKPHTPQQPHQHLQIKSKKISTREVCSQLAFCHLATRPYSICSGAARLVQRYSGKCGDARDKIENIVPAAQITTHAIHRNLEPRLYAHNQPKEGLIHVGEPMGNIIWLHCWRSACESKLSQKEHGHCAFKEGMPEHLPQHRPRGGLIYQEGQHLSINYTRALLLSQPAIQSQPVHVRLHETRDEDDLAQQCSKENNEHEED